MLDSKRVGTRLILTEFGFRLRAAFVILSDALAESNCEAAPKAESKRLSAQNDRFIFFQSYSVTEPFEKSSAKTSFTTIAGAIVVKE